MSILAPALRELPALGFSPTAARTVDYLRFSITDRCNERCLYCLPENYSAWTPREEALSFDEFLAIARAAAKIGFKHFRITGGGPLLRSGVAAFVRDLPSHAPLVTHALTTPPTPPPHPPSPLP